MREDGTRYATPMFVCLAAIVAADIAFAVDSIPAAFAITRDSVLIWMGNIFALLGLRALFVLVEGLIRRFRYLDETIAIVLGVVAVKLLIEDLYKVGPVVTLAIVSSRSRSGSSRRCSPTGATRSAGRSATSARRARPPHGLSAELAQLALDLGLDVERRLAARHAPRVARDDELADSVAQRRVDAPARSARCSSASTSSGGLAARGAAGVAGLEHLADLGLALGRVDVRRRSAPRGRVRGRRRSPPRADLRRRARRSANSETTATTAETPTTTKSTIAERVLHPSRWSHVPCRRRTPRAGCRHPCVTTSSVGPLRAYAIL